MIARKRKIIIVTQVIFGYRLGMFEKLSKTNDIEVLHGKDSKGTKKINSKKNYLFNSSKIYCFYIPLKVKGVLQTVQIMPFLFYELIKRKPDVILSEGTSNLFNASISFIYAKFFGCKYIWWSLGKMTNWKQSGIRKFFDLWIHYMEKHSDAILTYSSRGKEYFEYRGVSDSKIFKAINVIDTTSRWNQIEAVGPISKEEGFHLVFLGAIIKDKRLDVLLEAFKLLRQRYKDIYLHIVGAGPYLDAISEHPLWNQDGMTFHGRLDEKLSVHLLQWHLMILPGLGGLAIADAMLHGLLVICGRADGTELDLVSSDCGSIIPDMNAEQILNEVEVYYQDLEGTLSKGKIAQQRILDIYSFDNYISKVNECFCYVL